MAPSKKINPVLGFVIGIAILFVLAKVAVYVYRLSHLRPIQGVPAISGLPNQQGSATTTWQGSTSTVLAAPLAESGRSKWKATIDAKVKWEFKNEDGVFGYGTSKIDGSFPFDADSIKKTITLGDGKGLFHVAMSVDFSECEMRTMNDPNLQVTAINGIVNKQTFVFNKDSITLDHAEGVYEACANIASMSLKDASTLDLIKKYAFPITVDAVDGAQAPIHATYSFSGRQAFIDGTMTIEKIRGE